MRIAYKQKKHETFLRKQLLDDLHDELVQSIVEPLRVWTGAMLIKTCSQRFPGCNNACIGRKRAFVATQCMWRKKTMMKKSCRARFVLRSLRNKQGHKEPNGHRPRAN
jgi:hypothetical protein